MPLENRVIQPSRHQRRMASSHAHKHTHTQTARTLKLTQLRANAHAHTRALTHTHKNCYAGARAHHVHIWFGVSPVAPHRAVRWHGEGAGMRTGSPDLRQMHPKPLHENVWHFNTRAHSHAKTISRINRFNMHPRTHVSGSRIFNVATAPLYRCMRRSGRRQKTRKNTGGTRLRMNRVCTMSRKRGPHRFRLAAARDYTH